MSVGTTEETKCRVIQIMKDKGYVNKLYYITVEAAIGGIFGKKMLFKIAVLKFAR